MSTSSTPRKVAETLVGAAVGAAIAGPVGAVVGGLVGNKVATETPHFNEEIPSLGIGQLKRILVPLDFSKTAEKALRYADFLAQRFGAKITLLHVRDRERDFA